MKRRSQLMGLLVLTVFISVSLQGKDTTVQSLWTDTPIKLDAAADDWASVSMNHNKKTKVDFAFKNDGKYLYVYFTFTDLKYVSSLRQTGMTVWVNSEGGKKKKFGLKLSKMSLTADAWIAQLEKVQGPLPEDRKAQIRAKKVYMLNRTEIIDKKDNVVEPSAVSGELVPAAYQDVSTRSKSAYEIRIPLNISELSAGNGIKPGQTVSIGFAWGGMTKEMTAAYMKQRAAGTTRTRATGGTGGLRGERGTARSYSPGFRRPKKFDFWTSVKLAEK